MHLRGGGQGSLKNAIHVRSWGFIKIALHLQRGVLAGLSKLQYISRDGGCIGAFKKVC